MQDGDARDSIRTAGPVWTNFSGTTQREFPAPSEALICQPDFAYGQGFVGHCYIGGWEAYVFTPTAATPLRSLLTNTTVPNGAFLTVSDVHPVTGQMVGKIRHMNGESIRADLPILIRP